MHLRVGLTERVPGPHPRAQGRRPVRPAGHPAQAGRPAVRPQRRQPRPGDVPGPGRHRRDPPGLRGAGPPGRVVRRHHRPHRALRRDDGRDGRRAGGHRRLRRHPLRHRRRDRPAGHRHHRDRTARVPAVLREGGQAARGATTPGPHRARPRDAGRDRHLLGHRELQPPPRRPGPRGDPLHAARLLPQGLPGRHRREPRRRAPTARPVGRGPLPQGHAGRARLPPSLGEGQPPAALRRIHRAGPPGHLRLCHPGPLRDRALDADGRAGDPPHRPGRPGGHDPAHQGAGRRPLGPHRDHGGRRRPGAGHDLDQEDGGGPDRVPGRRRGARAVPALGHRHHHPDRDPARAPPRLHRRAGRHQPPAGGPRPARGGPGGHPRRRQGGLPAVGLVAHPDHGPGGAQRGRDGGALRRHHHRLHARGRLGDPAPPRDPDGLQPRARDRPDDDPQDGDRHPRAAPGEQRGDRSLHQRRAQPGRGATQRRRAWQQAVVARRRRCVHAGRSSRADDPARGRNEVGRRRPALRGGRAPAGRDRRAARLVPSWPPRAGRRPDAARRPPARIGCHTLPVSSSNGRSSRRSRCARAQSSRCLPRPAPGQADRLHRSLGVGEVVPGLRHHLRRGAAPLRRIPLGLRPAVPGPDGQARRRFHRGALARHLHRPEVGLPQPAFDRRHHHRGLRLPAAALCPHRPPALPELRPARGAPDAPADRRPGARAPRGHEVPGAGPGRPGPQGRVQHPARRSGQAGLLPGPGGRHPGRAARSGPRSRWPVTRSTPSRWWSTAWSGATGSASG